jgi:hypothetical protein
MSLPWRPFCRLAGKHQRFLFDALGRRDKNKALTRQINCSSQNGTGLCDEKSQVAPKGIIA